MSNNFQEKQVSHFKSSENSVDNPCSTDVDENKSSSKNQIDKFEKIIDDVHNEIIEKQIGLFISGSDKNSIDQHEDNPMDVSDFNNGSIISLKEDENNDNNITETIYIKSATTTGPYRCDVCDKEFRIMRYLEKHKRIHTGEKPYQCCYCGRHFNDWPNMNRHKRIHTGERPYRCNVCEKTFSQPAVYNEHIKRHTGERPFVCTICSKSFPRAARLTVHMRVHTGERPFQCSVCHRRFSQPHHLSAHIRIHTGDRPYVCDICDMSFACISNLRRHSKQLHKNHPDTKDICSDVKAPMISIQVPSKFTKKTRKNLSNSESKFSSINPLITSNNNESSGISTDRASVDFHSNNVGETQLLVDASGNIIIDTSSLGLNGQLNEDLLLGAKILQTSDGRTIIVANQSNQFPMLNNTGGITILGNDSHLSQQLFTTQNGTLYAAASNALLNSQITANNTSVEPTIQEKINSLLNIKNPDDTVTQNLVSPVKASGNPSEQQSQINSDILGQFNQNIHQQTQFHPTMFTILANGSNEISGKPSILFDSSGNAHQLSTDAVYLADASSGSESFHGSNQILQLQTSAGTSNNGSSTSAVTLSNGSAPNQSNQAYMTISSGNSQSQTSQNGNIILTTTGINDSVNNRTESVSAQQLINMSNGNTIILSGTAANLASISQLLQSNHLIGQNASMMVSLLPSAIQQTDDVVSDATTQAWFTTSIANSTTGSIHAQSTDSTTA